MLVAQTARILDTYVEETYSYSLIPFSFHQIRQRPWVNEYNFGETNEQSNTDDNRVKVERWTLEIEVNA